MDVFGLAANGAARPGVYVSLSDHEEPFAEPKPAAKNPTQFMIPSRRREHIEAGVARFLSVVPHRRPI
jgi:hypothetical protein